MYTSDMKKPASDTKVSSALAKRVYKEIGKIPRGKVLAYKQLAAKVGKPKAVRHIATLVGQNMNPIVIPCHRVVRSDGTLGQYSYKGKRDPKMKVALLKKEGVLVKGNKVVQKLK
jgi:methylated-DNA-[protein]-cysteine S-methyltransferase